jgi:hypothetical protein
MRRAVIMVAAAVLMTVVAARCGATSTTATQSGAVRHPLDAASPTPRGSSVAPVLSTITLDEFNRVELGMTLGQVTAIVGTPGTVDRASDKTRIESRWWDGRLGSVGFAMIVFRRGIVWGKTQVDLS